MRRKLDRELDAWFSDWYDHILEPALLPIQSSYPNETWPVRSSGHPENIVLPLLSSLPDCVTDPDNKYFVPFNEAKWQLRCGQANDILHDIRSKIGLYSFIWKKTSGTFGQAAKTRNAKTISKLTPLSRNMTVRPWMSSMVTKSLLCRRKQFLGFGATISVGGTQAYGKQKVRIDQICCIMSSFELMAILATRIEWFRSSARTTRWKKEKDILEDEMKRTQHFYLHFHLMWKERSKSEKQVGSMVSRGKAAFSAR